MCVRACSFGDRNTRAVVLSGVAHVTIDCSCGFMHAPMIVSAGCDAFDVSHEEAEALLSAVSQSIGDGRAQEAAEAVRELCGLTTSASQLWWSRTPVPHDVSHQTAALSDALLHHSLGHCLPLPRNREQVHETREKTGRHRDTETQTSADTQTPPHSHT